MNLNQRRAHNLPSIKTTNANLSGQNTPKKDYALQGSFTDKANSLGKMSINRNIMKTAHTKLDSTE